MVPPFRHVDTGPSIVARTSSECNTPGWRLAGGLAPFKLDAPGSAWMATGVEIEIELTRLEELALPPRQLDRPRDPASIWRWKNDGDRADFARLALV